MVITSKEVRTIGLLNRIKNAIEQGPAKGPEIDPLAEIDVYKRQSWDGEYG